VTPNRYRIIFSKRAADDLEEIFDFITLRSPQNAHAVIDRILRAIDGLEIFPHRTIVAGQPSDTQRPVRSLPVQSWIVLFEVDDRRNAVQILEIQHGARRG